MRPASKTPTKTTRHVAVHQSSIISGVPRQPQSLHTGVPKVSPTGDMLHVAEFTDSGPAAAWFVPVPSSFGSKQILSRARQAKAKCESVAGEEQCRRCLALSSTCIYTASRRGRVKGRQKSLMNSHAALGLTLAK